MSNLPQEHSMPDHMRDSRRRGYVFYQGRMMTTAAALDLADQLDSQVPLARAHEPEQPWYENPDSACPACGHGPRWHDDPTGCTRMVAGWCPCERVYLPSATGPEDSL